MSNRKIMEYIPVVRTLRERIDLAAFDPHPNDTWPVICGELLDRIERLENPEKPYAYDEQERMDMVNAALEIRKEINNG